MDLSTLVMVAAAFVLLIGVYLKAPESAEKGLSSTLALVLEILPRMVAAFVIAGLMQAIVPQDVIGNWMGKESGFRGILIGMDTSQSGPREFRSLNARPKKSLGVSDAMHSAAQSAAKLDNIFGRTIGQRVFGLGPYKLIRIKFWGIGREPMHMEPAVVAKEFLNDDTPVDGAAIPQEHNGCAQMPEEVAQEADDLHPRDVGGMEAKVKSKALSQWGDSDGGDGRDPIPPMAVSEDGGTANRRPGLADVRNEEEAAFVEECEMGPKSLGFFLSPATDASSSVGWPARLSVWPGAPASARSIRDPSSSATHGRGDTELRNVSRSAWRSVAGSTDPWYIPPPQRHAPGARGACVSETGITGAVGQASVWAEARLLHPCESPGPNVPPSLSKRSESRPRTDTSCQPAAEPRPDFFVLLAVEGFHGVACPLA